MLSDCGQTDASAVPLVFDCLMLLLHDPDSDVRETAEHAFHDLGVPAFSRLLEILKERLEDLEVQIHLVRALGHFQYAKETKELWPAATRQLERLLDHHSPEMRGAAALTMTELEDMSPSFIDRVEEMCRSTDLMERRSALTALRHATDSNPDLGARTQKVFLEALNQSDAKVKEAVEWALRDRGQAALPELVARMNHGNPTVRANVLATLSQFETDDLAEVQKRSIAQRICDALCDDHRDVRQAAAYASAQGRFVKNREESGDGRQWLSQCADEIAAIFQPSRKKLEALTIQRLLALSATGDSDERGSALHALWCIGNRRGGQRFRDGERVVAENLKHADENVRDWAYRAYRYFDVAPESLAATFTQGIDDPSCHVTESATRSLLEIAKDGVDVSPAIPVLCRLLERRVCDSYGGVYSPFEDACEILMLLPVEDVQPAIEPLVRALTSGESRVVAKAAESLWKLDQRVTESLPRLKELLDSGEMHTETFCHVIYRIGPAAAPLTPEVIKLLEDRSWDTQWAAADALGAIASSDPDCIRALIRALIHPSGIVRNAAIQALSHIGEEAVPLLISTLRGDDDEAKEMAADALGVIGAPAEQAVDDLRRLLATQPEGVADWSAIALGKITGSTEAVPRLMTILRMRPGRNIRTQTAEALGNIGPPARGALLALRGALDDPDEQVREAVAVAIGQIEGDD